MSDAESEADRIKADIEATRAELAETADALAAKLDVKAQAKQKVQAIGPEKIRMAAIGAGSLVTLLLLNKIRKRRRAAKSS